MKLKLLLLSAALACASLQAYAIGRMVDVTVVDRNSGATLPLHYYKGEYWVAGKPGARYAVAVSNQLGERVLAVTSVDGVNILSGQTASWQQTGYVFSGWDDYQMTGWRKSDSEVAAFEFAALGDSYAARTGRPGQVGVIGVALFRERQPEPVVSAPDYSRRRLDEDSAERRASRKDIARPSAESAAPAAPAPRAAEQGSSSNADSKGRDESAVRKMAPQPSPKLGTAHGQRETSMVSSTEFERAQSRPDEIIRIRYDSRENLVASGVIREPAVPGRPNPFPQSPANSYVPDPPPRRY